MLFPTLGPSSLPIVVVQPGERHANRIVSVLEWYERHKALYCSIISGLNEEDKLRGKNSNNYSAKSVPEPELITVFKLQN